MERKKRSKCSVWEFRYANTIFGTFGDEIKACGQKLVKCCAHTHAAIEIVGPTRTQTFSYIICRRQYANYSNQNMSDKLFNSSETT